MDYYEKLTSEQEKKLNSFIKKSKGYTLYWSLSKLKQYGTAILVKQGFELEKITYYPDPGLDEKYSTLYEQNGRIIIAEFKNYIVINVYIHNTGTGVEWDQPKCVARRVLLDHIFRYIKKQKKHVTCNIDRRHERQDLHALC